MALILMLLQVLSMAVQAALWELEVLVFQVVLEPMDLQQLHLL